VGRLLASGPGASPGRPTGGAGGAEGGGGPAAARAAAALLVARNGLSVSAVSPLTEAGDGDGGPAIVGGLRALAPTDAGGLAALAIGMILLAVTAVAAYALVDGRASPLRRWSVIRAARSHPSRADARSVLVLVVVSLAFWSAIALWLLTRR
jgi:hypothetical protein